MMLAHLVRIETVDTDSSYPSRILCDCKHFYHSQECSHTSAVAHLEGFEGKNLDSLLQTITRPKVCICLSIYIYLSIYLSISSYKTDQIIHLFFLMSCKNLSRRYLVGRGNTNPLGLLPISLEHGVKWRRSLPTLALLAILELVWAIAFPVRILY